MTRLGSGFLSAGGARLCWLAALLAFLLIAAVALAQEQVHPLKPPDRSSPRATLKTFLDSTDNVAAFLARDYVPSPSRARDRLTALSKIPCNLWT